MAMIVDGVYYVDNSTLKAVARCDTDAYLQYVCGYRLKQTEERAPLKSGTAIHEALATAFRAMASGSSALEAQILGFETLTNEYRDWALAEIPPNDRLGWPNISKLYNAWCEVQLGSLPFYFTDPRMVEIGFAHPLDEDGEFVFYGRMDGIANHVIDDSWVVVEHKTTGRMDSLWANQWHMDSQVSGYIWAAQQHNPEVFGCIINGIETSLLPSDEKRKCKLHGVPYSECGTWPDHLKRRLSGPITRTPEQILQWKKTALQLARRFQQMHKMLGVDPKQVEMLAMQGMFNASCKWCNVRDFCSVGRPIDRIDSMFEYAPWTPYDPLQFKAS